ncbi:MAG: FAD-dependent oxidoreductase [Nitrospira sp. CR1.3]|nr:FAD-dependent oxidoreductase [Nitrospira sp. CR1.3]
MNITRRDFLNGALLALGSTLLPPFVLGKEIEHLLADDSYPPRLNGMRGNHPGSFETAHAMAWTGKRDWDAVKEPDGTEYDLVVVGAGISGLSAAWFFQQQYGKDAKILLLENHDDFGGHARRNEFVLEGQMRVSYGGSQTIQNPGRYSRTAKSLLDSLGVTLDRFERAYDRDFFSRHGLKPMTYFDKKTFGRDVLLPYTFTDFSWGVPGISAAGLGAEEALNRMPLEARAKEQLLRVLSSREGSLDRIDAAKRLQYVKTTPYFAFLKDQLNVDDPQVLRLLRPLPAEYTGMGADNLSTLEAMTFGLPGITEQAVGRAIGDQGGSLSPEESEPYIHHFPDGNASIARLLVRQLIPKTASGSTMDDIVMADFDYHRLDQPDSPVRLRLNSTVVRVTHEGPAQKAHGVSVTYVTRNQAYRVHAKTCVLACYHVMIPHLVPELPQEQKNALREQSKAPLVYSTVLLKHWRPIKQLGLGAAECPGSLHQLMLLDYPVKLGTYPVSDDPDQPMVITMSHVPLAEQYGIPPRELFRQGRFRLFSMPFSDFETAIKEHLGGMLGAAGFDPDQDIHAITVNRWSHGYSYQGSRLYDPEMSPEKGPHILGRRPFGRITIANSDAGARAYMDAAIDEARRAVDELPRLA